MKLKLSIEKDGKQYYADGDKVFSWLMERYSKYQGRQTQGRVLPYESRVNNFFSLLTQDETWLEEMRKAFPGIDIQLELQKSKSWLLSNKAHKKDLKKFCYNWIAKAMPSATIIAEKSNEDVRRARKQYQHNQSQYSEKDCAEPTEIKDILSNYKKKYDGE